MRGARLEVMTRMGINENTLATFKPHEIAAYCLSEMLGSWDEDENKLLDEFWGVEPIYP